MQNNKFLDDFTRVATSAFSAAFDARRNIEDAMKRSAGHTMEAFGFVAREEFDVVRDMAAKARRENDELKTRISALETQLAAAKPRVVAEKTPAKQKKA